MRFGRTFALVFLVSAILVILGQRIGVAGHDLVRTVEFIGFSSDASKFLLLVRDEQAGDFFSLHSFDSGKQIKLQYVEDPDQLEKIKKELMATHKIGVSHVSSLKSPDGRFSLIGMQEGRRFKVLVMQGKKTAVLRVIDCEQGSSGVAQYSLKSAHWTNDGRKVVIIVHKLLHEENGIDADDAIPITFFPSSLRFE